MFCNVSTHPLLIAVQYTKKRVDTSATSINALCVIESNQKDHLTLPSLMGVNKFDHAMLGMATCDA